MKYLLLLSAFFLAATGCNRAPATAAATRGGFAIPVETIIAALERVEDKISAVGTLEANEMVNIRSELEGKIIAVEFREGDRVKKGDVLFRIDDAKPQAALESAEARFIKAKNNLERNRKLLEQQTISPQEFDDVQAEFKDASGLLTLARERLADATIRSPLDGSISERLVSEGQYIEKDRTLVSIVQTDPLKIDFSIPERFLPQLQLDQKVKVKVAALTNSTFTGDVYFIDPRVDPSTRSVKVKAHIANPDGALRPGLFANVELVAGIREQAVVIPEQAVVPQIDKLIVFVVENGAARRREVQLGTRMPGKVEITAGVSAGDEVVVAGQQKLRDQVPVQSAPPKTS